MATPQNTFDIFSISSCVLSSNASLFRLCSNSWLVSLEDGCPSINFSPKGVKSSSSEKEYVEGDDKPKIKMALQNTKVNEQILVIWPHY